MEVQLPNFCGARWQEAPAPAIGPLLGQCPPRRFGLEAGATVAVLGQDDEVVDSSGPPDGVQLLCGPAQAV